jgi:D-alanine-D-alanine ligase
MARIRVGVVRGGPSSEYDMSLKSGAAVLKHLPEDKYDAHDILITKDGMWHWRGIPAAPEKIARHFDVVWNALHGEYGADGQIQQLLESLDVPYTGSTAYASSVGMNKILAKEYFRTLGLRTPFGEVATQDDGEAQDIAHSVFRRISPPWIVKPSNHGSSVGMTLAKTFQELIASIEHAFSFSKKILIEEFVKGREASCGVVDSFRGKEHYSFLPVQIINAQHFSPGNFTRDESQMIQDAALKVHKGLGLRHYSHSDFIVSPRGVYILEVNSLPGMSHESLLPKSLSAVGCEYPQFLDHVLTLAMSK